MTDVSVFQAHLQGSLWRTDTVPGFAFGPQSCASGGPLTRFEGDPKLEATLERSFQFRFSVPSPVAAGGGIFRSFRWMGLGWFSS